MSKINCVGAFLWQKCYDLQQLVENVRISFQNCPVPGYHLFATLYSLHIKKRNKKLELRKRELMDVMLKAQPQPTTVPQ